METVFLLAFGFGCGYGIRELISRHRRADLRKRYYEKLARKKDQQVATARLAHSMPGGAGKFTDRLLALGKRIKIAHLLSPITATCRTFWCRRREVYSDSLKSR
jgi:hypothetical protein